MKTADPGYALLTTDVRLTLRVAGKSVELASIGPDDIVTREAVELDRCHAEIVMDVDGDRFVWPVELPDGAVPFDRLIRTIPAGALIRSTLPR